MDGIWHQPDFLGVGWVLNYVENELKFLFNKNSMEQSIKFSRKGIPFGDLNITLVSCKRVYHMVRYPPLTKRIIYYLCRPVGLMGLLPNNATFNNY